MIEDELEVIHAPPPRMPTRKELWRAVPMEMLGGSALTTALVFSRGSRENELG